MLNCAFHLYCNCISYINCAFDLYKSNSQPTSSQPDNPILHYNQQPELSANIPSVPENNFYVGYELGRTEISFEPEQNYFSNSRTPY